MILLFLFIDKKADGKNYVLVFLSVGVLCAGLLLLGVFGNCYSCLLSALSGTVILIIF